jgi:glyoxylate utilization-related uncharacterized protein
MKEGHEMEMKEFRVDVPDEKYIWLKTDLGHTLINQIILQESESMPENSTIHNIDMQVVYGRVALKLNDRDEHIYSSGSVISIPAKSKMMLSNQLKDASKVFLIKK